MSMTSVSKPRDEHMAEGSEGDSSSACLQVLSSSVESLNAQFRTLEEKVGAAIDSDRTFRAAAASRAVRITELLQENRELRQNLMSSAPGSMSNGGDDIRASRDQARASFQRAEARIAMLEKKVASTSAELASVRERFARMRSRRSVRLALAIASFYGTVVRAFRRK